MTTELPPLDNDPIATLAAAAAKDAALNSAGIGEISRLSTAVLAPLPYDREKSIGARAATVAAALADFPPPSKFKAAVKAAAELHAQAKAIGLKVQDLFGDNARRDYHKNRSSASIRLADGDSGAFDKLESESSVAARYQAQIDTLQASMGAIGFKQIEHALVIRDEIDAALGKLAAKLKSEDVESAKKYGLETDFSAETRLAVSVRILFARATLCLKPMENARPDTPSNFQLVRNTFRDFLPELAAW